METLSLSLRSPKFRHIVFADSVRRRDRAANLAPSVLASSSAACTLARNQCATAAELLQLAVEVEPTAPESSDPLSSPARQAAGAADPDLLSLEERSLLRSVFEPAALDMRAYRAVTLARRVPGCLRAIRAVSVNHARPLLPAKPGPVKVAVYPGGDGGPSFFPHPPPCGALRAK